MITESERMYITVEDEMSQLIYPAHDLYTTQVTPPQQKKGGGEAKAGRRRKKAKAMMSGSGDNNEEGGGGGGKKRKLSEEQAKLLEMNFGCEHKLESERKDRIASELGLDPRQVAVWFQNRRARWKNKKLEDEYSKLRAEHEAAILDKCRLEAEVINLRDKLMESEKEIRKLRADRMDNNNNISSNSPASSLTMDANHHHATDQQRFLGGGGFGCLDGFVDHLFYAPVPPEINTFFPGMDILAELIN